MIVPMKKVFILTQSKDASAAVKSLRKLGALHVENQEPPKGEDINSIREDLAAIEKAIGILSLAEFYEKRGVDTVKMLKDLRSAAKHLQEQIRSAFRVYNVSEREDKPPGGVGRF
jgi:vacuolar-type H+-ATPase subunit I/STV1